MRKDELQLLGDIQKIEKNQLYLLESPKTPQQKFLHLFAHRHLLRQKMLNKNIDNVMDSLQGSFAQSSLKLAYVTLCIENQIELADDFSPLLKLIQSWIPHYSSISNNKKLLLSRVILQENKDYSAFNGFDLYLSYLDLISIDLWKLVKRSKNETGMFSEGPLRNELKECKQGNFSHLDWNDLLSFISSCIPKGILNIILAKENLPQQLKAKYNKLEVLYSNQQIEFYLRTSTKLPFLLRQLFSILITQDLSPAQQKFLMLVAFRYFYAFQFDKRFSAPQIIIYAFNKLDGEIRKELYEQFALFFKILLKMGREKFVSWVAQNSEYLRQIIELVRQKPMVGYPQESASPYNTVSIGQTIVIERGSTVSRCFEILQDASIFYFRINIPSLDITVKLSYLGEISSPKPQQSLLLTHEKISGQLKNCINAMKRGLYMFEFDNSYSWINGKTVIYQLVVFTPLEIKHVNADEWIYDFYENIVQNEIADEKDIVFISNKKPEPQENLVGTAGITKKEDLFGLKVNKKNEQYVYETDNGQRMLQKIKDIAKGNEKYKWSLLGKAANFSQIEDYLAGNQKQSQQMKEEEIIEPKYEEEGQNDAQYEVVENQLEKSQIVGLQKKKAEIESRKSEKKEKTAPKPKKQQILCNLQEAEDFYKEEK